MMKNALGVAALSLLAACAGMGHGMSKSLVELAQETRMGGEFVLEVEQNGSVVGAEAEISPSDVPQACRDAAQTHAPGGQVTGAEKEVVKGKTYYELRLMVRGRRVEVMMKPDGTQVGREEELAPSDVPAGIVDAARSAVPDGTLVVVERVSGPEALVGESFHVKLRVHDEIQRVSVTQDGKVVKILRKIKAEVKVPRK